MKRLLLGFAFILSITLISCSDKKDNAETSKVGNNTVVQNGEMSNKSSASLRSDETTFERKIQEGKIILLYSTDETAALRYDKNIATTITLPDGKEYQAKKDDDNILLNVPGKGEMQIINLNDKFYLFDNRNQAYEVKFNDNRLYAEATSLKKELLKNK